jgi:prepilin-type N-terminal cleavage/methylation domain-containing protein
MNRLIRFILNSQLKLKRSQVGTESRGFTLIEILVALIIAALIITPLLGFMITILKTDRDEQAKATSEQEIQSALEYMARDLEQAIYIYDVTGIAAITGNDGIPADTNKVPVLVFWKRQFIPDAVPAGLVPCKDDASLCPQPPSPLVDCSNDPDSCDDTFVYSLVGYYLIKDDTCDPTSTWSCTARIGRFQISDGIYIHATNPIQAEDPGFDRFNLNQGGGLTFKEKMNSWTKDSESYANSSLPENNILIDYVSQSTTGLSPNCDPNVGAEGEEQVPATLTGGFYTCVNTEENGTTSAKIFIRGNAKARIEPKTNPPSYSANNSTYFPSAEIRVKGRGLLGN